MGMLILLLLKLKGARPTSDAWAYMYLQHGYVQQLSKYVDTEANRFLLKVLHFFILPDDQLALRKPLVSQTCYSKCST